MEEQYKELDKRMRRNKEREIYRTKGVKKESECLRLYVSADVAFLSINGDMAWSPRDRASAATSSSLVSPLLAVRAISIPPTPNPAADGRTDGSKTSTGLPPLTNPSVAKPPSR